MKLGDLSEWSDASVIMRLVETVLKRHGHELKVFPSDVELKLYEEVLRRMKEGTP